MTSQWVSVWKAIMTSQLCFYQINYCGIVLKILLGLTTKKNFFMHLTRYFHWVYDGLHISLLVNSFHYRIIKLLQGLLVAWHTPYFLNVIGLQKRSSLSGLSHHLLMTYSICNIQVLWVPEVQKGVTHGCDSKIVSLLPHLKKGTCVPNRIPLLVPSITLNGP